ncbi:MAG: 2Fe-2S iron-sulfur cluster-binding protein [Terriglobales bacterium]|jgi:2Fe-2S ferredoxin
MAEEKTQGTGAATVDAPGANTVKVTFLPEGKTVEFELGKMPYKDHGKAESLLDVALNHHVFLDHACGGNCACTTCHVQVIKGADLLSEMDDEEADRLDLAADLQLNSRLGCQCVITKPGEIVVNVPEWNRNYVSEHPEGVEH